MVGDSKATGREMEREQKGQTTRFLWEGLDSRALPGAQVRINLANLRTWAGCGDMGTIMGKLVSTIKSRVRAYRVHFSRETSFYQMGKGVGDHHLPKGKSKFSSSLEP